MNRKIKWPHQESNPIPSEFYQSAQPTTLPRAPDNTWHICYFIYVSYSDADDVWEHDTEENICICDGWNMEQGEVIV
jgi:hypothetical protein